MEIVLSVTIAPVEEDHLEIFLLRYKKWLFFLFTYDNIKITNDKTNDNKKIANVNKLCDSTIDGVH